MRGQSGDQRRGDVLRGALLGLNLAVRAQRAPSSGARLTERHTHTHARAPRGSYLDASRNLEKRSEGRTRFIAATHGDSDGVNGPGGEVAKGVVLEKVRAVVGQLGLAAIARQEDGIELQDAVDLRGTRPSGWNRNAEK